MVSASKAASPAAIPAASTSSGLHPFAAAVAWAALMAAFLALVFLQASPAAPSPHYLSASAAFYSSFDFCLQRTAAPASAAALFAAPGVAAESKALPAATPASLTLSSGHPESLETTSAAPTAYFL